MKGLLLMLLFFANINDFDFKKSSAIDLLDYLYNNPNERFFIVNPDSVPTNWLSKKDIHALMDRIESERITTPIFSINASVDLEYKNRTTEGVEALFMIESFRKNKKYPYDLSSQSCGIPKNGVFYPNQALIIEIKDWYKAFK